MSNIDSPRVTVTGAAGRMGQTMVELIVRDNELILTGAVEQTGSEVIDQPVSDLAKIKSDVTVTDDPNPVFSAADIVIDFTHPDATEEFLGLAERTDTRLVIGTTGFNEDQNALLERVARRVAIVKAPNMSIGVNLLVNLISQATEVLGEDFDAEIVEMHHRHKKDAPSGTAMLLARTIAETRNQDLESTKKIGREGFTGERSKDEIGIASLRGGDVVGDHTVSLAGEGERIELTHRASSRETFGRGALRAAKFLTEKSSGLYSMKDVLF